MGAGSGAGTGSGSGAGEGAGVAEGTGSAGAVGAAESVDAADTAEAGGADRTAGSGGTDAMAGTGGTDAAAEASGADGTSGTAGTGGAAGAAGAGGAGRRFALTRDTARPEGGGRAAPGGAPAPARQWPLLSVVGTVGLGLLIVGANPFAEAFRIGTILVGIALIGGAVLRRVLPSVGMLAVRSRFTDMLTYGLLGVAIVLLSLMTQPRPWLEIPFLEDTLHFTVR
ncbi:DUF3017 domain-containing protein [Streptomyces sp. NPDC093085]|uniref:DUF3017 domain-containing protein n=1 Tax=Streptomyces sp. NPDC093085 TaxID=3155068 RepID=UPI00341A5491